MLGSPASRNHLLKTRVRRAAIALAMVAAVGCTGVITDGTGGPGEMTEEEKAAREKFTAQALPVLQASCMGCHGGQRPVIDFLAGATGMDIRERLSSYEPAVVNLDMVGSSRLLTKGLHDGPQLTASQSSAILTWLQAEQDSANHDPAKPVVVLATPPFSILPCSGGFPDNSLGTCPTNHISITGLGSPALALPGAEISFNAQPLESGLYLTNLKVNGGTAGAYLEHPLFVSRPDKAAPMPDPIDRFVALKLNQRALGAEYLGGGTAQFSGFRGTDKLQIHFKVLAAFKPETGPITPSGCRVLPSFKANVVPALRANCTRCHAGASDPNARNTMDLTGFDSPDDAVVQVACNQVRSRADLIIPGNSGIFRAPDPASTTNHPFKFAAAATFTTDFKTPVDLWVQAEKLAP